MEIIKVLKTKKGIVTFKGEITEAEHEYILTVGLNSLLEQGALPFTSIEDDEDWANTLPVQEGSH
jgi:hypothetical protein